MSVRAFKFAMKPAILSVAVICCGVASAAQGQSVRLLGDFRDWSAYATSDSAGKVCFAVSKPKTTTPAVDGLGPAFFYITHRPSENIRHELNLVSGYTFGPGSAAEITVGSQRFDLFTDADAAWLENTALSSDVAGYLRAGSTMSIEGTTDKGIKVSQDFSLSGVTAASRAIDNECR